MAKTYKCPYCEKRFEREKLIDHVEDVHEDLIPEQETPTQVVFNSINKKTSGTCVICKKPTSWNEKAGRYNRLCDNPKCKEKMREDFKKNSLQKHGTYNFTADPEFQEKMLKSRKISSTYTFTDGGKIDYVGSYEKKFLEFCDKVMNIESKDIIGPGPIIEYTYNGETHYWITDFYYVPGNLVLDIKDGGDNPNTRPMEEYREKQTAKEAAIRKMRKYNYLRLTNNNFAQFMEVLADLKLMALDMKDKQLITKINESNIQEFVGGMPPMYSSDGCVLKAVDDEGNTITALSSLEFNDNVLIDDEVDGIKKISKKEFKEKYKIKEQFKFKKDEKYYNLLEAFKNKDACIYNGIYNNLSSFDINLMESQIYFDDKFIKVELDKTLSDMRDKLSKVNECVTSIDEYTFINNAKLYDLIEESPRMETLLTTNPFEKEMTLYHGSYQKLNIIEPKSINGGTKLSKPRVSSFWIEIYEYARKFAFFRLIESKGFTIFFTMDNDHFLVKPSEYDNIIKSIKNDRLYIYEKTLSKEYIGIGHSSFGEEYTIDLPVKPDKVYVETYNQFKYLIKYLEKFDTDDDKEINKIVKDNISVMTSKDVSLSRTLVTHKFSDYRGIRKNIRHDLLSESYIEELYNEIKAELEDKDPDRDGFFFITPSKDKDDLDDQYQKFNGQNPEQKKKADIRSVALYGRTNYDHYHILLSKITKGTKEEDDEDTLVAEEYIDKHDEKVYDDRINYFEKFGVKSWKELYDKNNSAKNFNKHTTDRVIIYPDITEYEKLYMKFMALDSDDRVESDAKTKEMFGMSNREMYNFIKQNLVPHYDNKNGSYKADTEDDNDEKTYNDLPLLSPKELSNEVHEDYSCFNQEDANIIKVWRESYDLLGQGILQENYRQLNLQRLNILRKSIYENNIDGIIQCGWLPDIEFNSENRVKASKLVNQKIQESKSNIIKYEDLEESVVFNQEDLYWNFDKFENGKSNILLITGLSGSGKSTLAKSLASKYKAKYIELDKFDYRGADGPDDDEYGDFMYNKIKECIKDAKNQKTIIEGIQIYELFKDEARNYPLIIKGTSSIKSFFQKTKREKWSYKEFLKYSKEDLSWLIKSDKDLNELRSSVSESVTINEASSKLVNGKRAVSIVLVQGDSLLGKTIRSVQKSDYSHASISLDDDLDRIYSYNMRGEFDGLAYESIEKYVEQGVKQVGVYTFLVSDKVYKNMEKSLDNFVSNINKTKYSVLNLLTIPLNIPVDMDMKLVCSEFVDKLLKSANVDITNKQSSLVSPKDFSDKVNSTANIVEVFKGNPAKLNKKEISRKINKLKRSNLFVYESVEYMIEAKSLPIRFDSEGNLIIKNIRNIDLEQEYANSHRLLMQYEKTNSYEPMKFELAKMHFLINLMEKKIYKKDEKELIKIRARYLNDYNKYLAIIVKNDKTFNFTEYYNESPFSDAEIKIDKSTMKYGWKALKYMITETAVVTSDEIRSLKIYLRNSKEASRASSTSFKQHYASFKVLKGSNILADVYVINPNTKPEVIIDGEIPQYAISFIKDFAIKNNGNIRALWDTSRDSKNYDKIIKRIQKNNPNCEIRINK